MSFNNFKPIKPKANTIFRGDNLEILKALPDNFIDLVYIDPPFYSQKDYKNIWGSKDSVVVYEDEFDGFKDTKHHFEYLSSTGAKGLNAYLEWLELRLVEIHRILKPTGSFYLHLDYHAVHYAKIILDRVFGYNNFRNEIIWRRKTGSNSTSIAKRLPCNTDTILFYTKSNNYTFHQLYTPHNEDYVKKAYRFDDKDGRGLYRLGDMSAPSYSPTLVYNYKGYEPPAKGWRYNLASMKRLDKEGKLHFPKSKDGRIQYKRFLAEVKGNPIENIWDDIGMLQNNSKEKTGWSTQKPIPLLERIIEQSSNEGDLIFDCFAGCGTSMEAAHNLKRQWIGIDISKTAVEVNEERLLKRGATVHVVDENDLAVELSPVTKKSSKKAA